ncbi:MAG: hypothetical protein QXX17_03150 [Conexivisphaerales archaeon]
MMVASSVSGSFGKLDASKLRGALGELGPKIVLVKSIKLLAVTVRDTKVRIQPDESIGFKDLPFKVMMTAGVYLIFSRPATLFRILDDIRCHSRSTSKRAGDIQRIPTVPLYDATSFLCH